jgi:hypothetical protein
LGAPEIPEVIMTSPTAPGATHRWTSIRAYADEVALARIWAGFHYRFSVNIGREMGRKIGEHVVSNAMQPSGACGNALIVSGPLQAGRARRPGAPDGVPPERWSATAL